jgi:hypothetical protein
VPDPDVITGGDRGASLVDMVGRALPKIGWAPVVVLLVVACSAGGASPDPTRVLAQAGQAMAGLKTVSADIRFGPGVEVQGLTLASATSKIRLPGDSDTVFKVRQGDYLVDLRVVTTEGRVYLRLPFSAFVELPPDRAAGIPDPSRLMDRSSGLPALLPEGRSARYVRLQQVSGTSCDEVTAAYTGSQLGRMIGRPVAGEVQATIWAGRSDHLVRKALISGSLGNADRQSQIEVDLHGFNQPVDVAAPG